MKNIRVSLSEKFQFLEVNFSIYLKKACFRDAVRDNPIRVVLLPFDMHIL